jgi:branched-chain amino acid transport system substrate-binding protein
MRRNTLPAALAALALAAAGACSENAVGPAAAPAAALKPGAVVKIGVVLEFSGPTATYGEETFNGIEMALEDLKGKDPWTIEVKRMDNKSDPQETARAVQQLTTVDDVAAIIGAVASKNTKAGARIANDSEVPMISPGSTATDVTTIGPYISRVCFIDDFQGEVMARFAWSDLGKKTAALVVDRAQDYCVGLAKSFQETYEKLGGKILVTANYTTGESDFAALIEKVAAAKPECIWIPGYYGDVGPLLKQAERKWAGLPKLGGDGWDSPQLFALAGSAGALKDCYMSSHFAPDDAAPTVHAFGARSRKKYNNEPGSMSVLGYDAMLLLHDALVRAGTTDGKKLKDAINATRGLKGVTGIITLDQNRNPKKDAVILIPENGKFKFRARVAPAGA